MPDKYPIRKRDYLMIAAPLPFYAISDACDYLYQRVIHPAKWRNHEAEERRI